MKAALALAYVGSVAIYALTALGVLWTALLIVRGPDALRHRPRPGRPLLVPTTGRAGVAPPGA